jgi:hypothetical protein
MTISTPQQTIRELDRRTNDGIDVRLLWDSATGQVVVAVHDARTDDAFELHVAATDARFAFQHPYAYAGTCRTDHLLAA